MSAASTAGGLDGQTPTTTVIQWVLDTRKLWPEVTKTAQLAQAASRAMALLTEPERDSVLRYYFPRDAKLALGSILVKRLAISRHCGVSWSAATPTRDERTKPVFLMPGTGAEPLIFNVSHQAGLVVLLAAHSPAPGLALGVDVVCPSERRDRDLATVAKEGWPQYVDMHADVFSPDEVARLKALPFGGPDRLLAYFYSLWCLREAYVKMTGEALLASWLKQLEFRYFSPPGEVAPEEKPLEIWFRGERVDDVDIRLEPLLDGYAIGTSVKRAGDGTGIEIGEFVSLDIDELLTSAEAANTA